MSIFTLAISCLTTSNLPWFMDLTFQVPMQYCSLQYRTLLLSPVPSTTGCCFCFGSIPSFFLELFLHLSPVAYWAPNDLGSSSFSVSSFGLFILFVGFSRPEYWSGLPFPSPVDHILSDLSTMTCQSWVAHRAWLSFIKLDKAVVCVIRLASRLWLLFQSVCPLMPYLSTYRLTWVSLTLDVGYLLTAAPEKRSHCSSPWTRGSSSWLSSCAVAVVIDAALLHHCSQWLEIKEALFIAKLPRIWRHRPFPKMSVGIRNSGGKKSCLFLNRRKIMGTLRTNSSLAKLSILDKDWQWDRDTDQYWHYL